MQKRKKERNLPSGPIRRENPEVLNPLPKGDVVLCDRCSGPMFRMRAVYWCTNCGYKTDCCGS